MVMCVKISEQFDEARERLQTEEGQRKVEELLQKVREQSERLDKTAQIEVQVLLEPITF